jgi:hypothetical protein
MGVGVGVQQGARFRFKGRVDLGGMALFKSLSKLGAASQIPDDWSSVQSMLFVNERNMSKFLGEILHRLQSPSCEEFL